MFTIGTADTTGTLTVRVYNYGENSTNYLAGSGVRWTLSYDATYQFYADSTKTITAGTYEVYEESGAPVHWLNDYFIPNQTMTGITILDTVRAYSDSILELQCNVIVQDTLFINGRDSAKIYYYNDTLHIIANNIKISNGGKTGVFAYLDTTEVDTVDTANVYQPIGGTFINSPLQNFSVLATPSIRYDGATTHYFMINYNTTSSANANGTTFRLAVKKNGTILDGSIMSTYLKTANEAQAFGGVVVVELDQNDTIQLVFSTDGTGDIVNFMHFTTTINKFFEPFQ